MRYTATVKYYSAMKKNEVLTHGTVWMNAERIMPSEGGQTQNVTCCTTPFI